MKTIVIGVMPQDQIRARTLAIARGDYKPKPGEPKIWFTSMKSVAEVLSDQNRALLNDTIIFNVAGASASTVTHVGLDLTLSGTISELRCVSYLCDFKMLGRACC